MTMIQSRPVPLLDDDTSASRSEADAGFGALETARGGLPLAALDVVSRIDGLLSQVTIRQTFVNATDEPLEATYIFPLPDRASVTDFRMEVAGRMIEGVLKERAQARREYNQALRQGYRASIAEEDRPGVFSLRVGNVMPGDVATVQLTLVGILPYHDGEVTFRFPLVVAPRYIPGVPLSGPSVGGGTAVDTNAVPDASRISPPVLLPGFPNPVRLSLTIDVYEPADNLRVSLFTVWGEEQAGFRRLALQPGERLDRDFILRFRLGGDVVRTSLSLHPDTVDSAEGTFAVTIVPPVSSVGAAAIQRPRDVVLLLDRSGSMGGWKIVAARRAIARMIDTLRNDDRFAVFAFDDRIEAPPFGNQGPGFVAATDRNRFKGVEFLAKLESRGGTEIARPLDKAVGLLDECGHDRDRILVVVTDGQVGNEDQVLKLLGARLLGIRIFTLGIDQAVNEGFLRRLAAAGRGGGSCELVESEDRLDAVMDAIHCRIGTPVATEVRLESEASGLVFLAETLVPDRPPSLFRGSPLLLMGRYRGQRHGPVEVRGKTADATVWSEAVVARVRDNPAIASACARTSTSARGSLCRGDRRSLGSPANHHRDLATFRRLVPVHRVRCRRPRRSSQRGGEVHQITQPVEMPAGWSGDSMLRVEAYMAPEDASIDAMCFTSASAPTKASRVYGGSDGQFGDSPCSLSSLNYLHRPVLRGSSAPPPKPPTSEERLTAAGFHLTGPIGQDAHGTVYRGMDERKRSVMVRVLKKPVSLASPAAFAKLQKELKGLKHPAIVPILELIGGSPQGPVIAVVCDHIVGPTLTHWLSQAGQPDVRQAAFFVLVIAEALEYSRRRLIIHGSLTPDHILIGADGKPRITDFGLSSLDCGPDVSCATVRAYVAPELLQSPGMRPTGQADVYSLGVIFYQLLTGVLPDRDQNDQRPQSPRAINPQVPVELEAICLKAVAPEPTTRYATAGELATDLRKFLGIKKRGLLAWKTGRLKSEPGAPATQ